MELLTCQSLYSAVAKCRSSYNHHVLVFAKDLKQRDFIFKELCSMEHSEHQHYFYRVSYATGSTIKVMAATQHNLRGNRADLVLIDPELFQADLLPIFRSMEITNINFKLSNKGE